MQRIIIIYSTIIVFTLCKQDSKGIVDVPYVIRIVIRQTGNTLARRAANQQTKQLISPEYQQI